MPNQWHQLHCLVVLLMLGASYTVQGASQTWGFTIKYATLLYDVELKRVPAISENKNSEVPWIDLLYPERGDSGNYTIIGMHAFDEIGGEQGSQALLMAGGVNYSYAMVRFMPCSGCGLHFRLTIYGLQL